MMNKKIFISLLLAAIGASIVSVSACWFFVRNQQQYAFVDVIRLTQSYHLKKELEKEAQRRLQTSKNQLDSLRFQAEMANGNSPESRQVQQYYLQAEYQYNLQLKEVDQQLSAQVWDRLNPLIERFSKERKLKLLVGATGTGSLLYGDSSLDLTNDLISYINKGHAN